MSDQTIKCPACGASIELGDALTGPIEAGIKARYAAEALVKDREVEARLRAVAAEAKVLAGERESLEEKVAERLSVEKKKLAGAAYEKARGEEAERTKSLEAEIAEQGAKLRKAQGEELALRKQQRELEQKAEELELTVERKIGAERKKIAEDAQRKAAEAGELKMREKDDMVVSLKKQLEDIDPSAGSGRGGGWSRDRRSGRVRCLRRH